NSEVKRCCGNDSLGVALRKNSSMPGFIIHTKSPMLRKRGSFCFLNFLANLFPLLSLWENPIAQTVTGL
ncbi:hypothetical protein, partial [Nostoc sp.]|uniref:hypothetical protein n=1 Tax=Nostoc sp. TaxID=1180 RepID=UPI002FF9D045